MSPNKNIPQEIIDLILEKLAERINTPSANSHSIRSSLTTCSRVSRSFYWAATIQSFRHVQLSLAHMDIASWEKASPEDEALMSDLNVPLQNFAQIVPENRDLLSHIRSVHIVVDPRQFILKHTSSLWDILDCLTQNQSQNQNHALDIKSISIVGPRGSPWNQSHIQPWVWLTKIDSADLPTFTQFIGLATEKLHLDTIFIKDIWALGRFRNVRHLSLCDEDGLSHHHFTNTDGPGEHVNVAQLYQIPGAYPFTHVQKLTLELSSPTSSWQNEMIPHLHLIFRSLETLEIIHGRSDLYTDPEYQTIKFAAFTNLKTLHLSFSLEYLPIPHHYAWDLTHITSKTLSKPLFKLSCPNAPTAGTETIAITFSLHYQHHDLDRFIMSLRTHRSPLSCPVKFNPDVTNFLWSDFRPDDALLRVHPRLRNMNMILDIQSSRLGPGDLDYGVTKRVYTPYEYDVDKKALSEVLEGLIMGRIVGGGSGEDGGRGTGGEGGTALSHGVLRHVRASSAVGVGVLVNFM